MAKRIAEFIAALIVASVVAAGVYLISKGSL